MKKIIPVLIITVFVFVSCKDKKQGQEQKQGQDTVQQKTEEGTPTLKQDPALDSVDIRKVITDFYNWYNKNYAKFQNYDLYSSIKKKNAPPYKINWDVVAKYQDFIRTSVPQLGEEFISNQKRFFQQCDSAFKVDVKDDIPYGFDWDWYTNSQEDPQYLLDEMNKSKQWIIAVKDNDATVNIKGNSDNRAATTVINLTMKKENGQWKIAKIGTE